jgi:hypothetical protein
MKKYFSTVCLMTLHLGKGVQGNVRRRSEKGRSALMQVAIVRWEENALSERSAFLVLGVSRTAGKTRVNERRGRAFKYAS